MAIGSSPVQTDTTQGGKTGTFGSNTTAGNAIIVLVGTGASFDVTNVTDDNSNSYTEIVKNTTGDRRCAIWFAVNITGGATTAVTVTTGENAGDVHIVLAEWDTTAADFEVDQSNTADSSGVTNHPKGSITTVHNDTLVVGAFRSSAGFTVTSRETSYSEIAVTSRLDAIYKVFSSTTTTDADITTDANEDGGNVIASLNEIAAGGVTVPVFERHYRSMRGE